MVFVSRFFFCNVSIFLSIIVPHCSGDIIYLNNTLRITTQKRLTYYGEPFISISLNYFTITTRFVLLMGKMFCEEPTPFQVN